MAENLSGYVAQDTVFAESEGGDVPAKASKRGELVVMNWYTQMAMEGRVYQVRAGTISVPLVGDLLITDQSAEMCADAAAGTTIIPTALDVSINLNTGILNEMGAKSVGAVSTAGAAFVPLNLLLGGSAATSTARVEAAGAVSVTAEAATTTRRHWANANPLAVAAGHGITSFNWEPIAPPTLVGPSCFYVQIAASGTGPSYFASFDYIELTTNAVS